MKKYIKIIISIFLLSLLTACSGTGTKFKPIVSTNSSGTTNLYFVRSSGFVAGGILSKIEVNGQEIAKLGVKDSVKLPEPIINRAGCNLSFAGLKTAVLRESKKINREVKLKYNLAASFQNTINKILYKKTKVAVEMFREKTKQDMFQLIVAGGVAANESIRTNLSSLSNEMNFKTIYPDLEFCGDNAAMIAWAGIKRFKKNLIDDLNISAKSRWQLDGNAPYMKGPGLKL